MKLHRDKKQIILFIILTFFLGWGGIACASNSLAAGTVTAVSNNQQPTANNQQPASITGLTDPALVVTPAPLTAPVVNGSVTDPVFGSSMRRITDSGSNGFATQIYSQLQAFSADNQYILLIEDEWYTVRRRDTLATLLDASDTASWNDPRWHPTQADTIIHFDDNADTTLRLQFTNVNSGQTSTVFTFPATYTHIRSNQSFDEISLDGRFLAGMATLSDGDSMLFTLNIETGTLGAQMRLSADLYGGACAPDPQWGEVEPDWIGVSPLGNTMTVQWTRDGTTRCSGLETFNINTGAFVGRVYDGHQHGDMGVMADGTTEFFMTIEVNHPSGMEALSYRVLPGNATVQDPVYLTLTDWMIEHISCKGPSGVCLITTRDNGNGSPDPLEDELFLQNVDGSVERLAHHRSSACGYWVQPRASWSKNGRYVIFATDWGSGICSSPVDLGAGDPYIIDLQGSSTPPPDFTPTAFVYLPTVTNNAQGSVPTPTPAPGGGSFTQQPIDTAVNHGQHVNVVDLDKDGDEDVILSLSLDDGINLYRNDGNGQFTMSQIAPNDTIVAMETAVSDIDKDGDLDVAAVGLFDRGPCGWGSGAFCEQPGVVVWYENPGNVAGSWTRHDVASLWGARTITTADLTGNGRSDLIIGSVALFGQADGLYWVGQGTNGVWTAVNTLDATLGNVEATLSHDVDGDSVPDVLAVNRDGDQIVWFENGRSAGNVNNNPTFSSHILATPSAPYGLTLANMDGDAALELIATSDSGTAWYDSPTNPASVWTTTLIDANFGTGVDAHPAAADFDGDGDTDVAVLSTAAAALRWYENDGGWTSHAIGDYSGGTGFAAGDMDGNGKPDLISTTYNNDSGSDRLDWWQNQ